MFVFLGALAAVLQTNGRAGSQFCLLLTPKAPPKKGRVCSSRPRLVLHSTDLTTEYSFETFCRRWWWGISMTRYTVVNHSTARSSSFLVCRSVTCLCAPSGYLFLSATEFTDKSYRCSSIPACLAFHKPGRRFPIRECPPIQCSRSSIF